MNDKISETTIAKAVALRHATGPVTQLFKPFNWFKKVSWVYVALSLPALITFVMVINDAATQNEPAMTVAPAAVDKVTQAQPPKHTQGSVNVN